MTPAEQTLRSEIQRMQVLLDRANIFVEDVMPQVGILVIQDFANLNELCMGLSIYSRKDRHLWAIQGDPGMYDTTFKCLDCGDLHTESADDPDSSLPDKGCPGECLAGQKHNWVDATNEVVKSGRICTVCHKVRA